MNTIQILATMADIEGDLICLIALEKLTSVNDRKANNQLAERHRKLAIQYHELMESVDNEVFFNQALRDLKQTIEKRADKSDFMLLWLVGKPLDISSSLAA